MQKVLASNPGAGGRAPSAPFFVSGPAPVPRWTPGFPGLVAVDQTFSFGNDTLRSAGGTNVMVGDDMSIVAPTISIPADRVLTFDRATGGLVHVQDEFVDAERELIAATHDLREVLVPVIHGKSVRYAVQDHIDRVLFGNDVLVGGAGEDLMVGDTWSAWGTWCRSRRSPATRSAIG